MMDSVMRLDLVLEHLERAEDEFSRRSWAHDGSTYTPAILEQRVERLLLANLDALVVAGAGTKDLLRAALLEEDDASHSRRVCAGMALIGLGAQDEVVEALKSDNPDAGQGALEALIQTADSRFDNWLRQELSRQASDTPRKVLLQGAVARNIGVSNLLVPLQSSDDEEVALAAELAQHADSGLHRPLMEYLTEHSSPSVRNAALLSGLVFGSGRAYRACIAAAEDSESPNAFAMLLAALANGASAAPILTGQLTQPSHVDAAAFALGASGGVEAVETLLQYLDHGRLSTARLAGEALATITGLDLREGPFERPEPDDADEEDEDVDPVLMPRGFSLLPLADRDAVIAWWRKSGGRQSRDSSCLDGRPWSFESALHYLQHAPLRRRHAVALWLAIHSGGAVRVSTRRSIAFQRAQLAHAAALPQRFRVRNFERMT